MSHKPQPTTPALSLLSLSLLLLLLSIGAARCGDVASNATVPEEMFLSTPDLIKYWGYPSETHEVRTDDGYLLTMHRIPHGKHPDTATTARPVMLLLPGLLLDSTIYVMNLPHQSLGYVLADAGYDVWIGNNRGNTFSKKHQFLNTNDSRFWDFSYQEMAELDLPAMVDYALQKSGQQQVFLVGYSLGTTIGFCGLADSPALQKKVRKFFAMAPITVSDGGPPSLPVRMLGHWMIDKLSKTSIREVLPFNQLIEFAAEVVCPMNLEFCRDMIGKQSGGVAANINATRVPLYLMHMPAGTSMKNMLHIMQKGFSNQLKKYDYTWWGNLIMYGSLRAPVYDLTKITTPTVMFTGTDDRAARDYIHWTSTQLGEHLEGVFYVEGYGHDHFFLGMDAREKVFKKLIEMAV